MIDIIYLLLDTPSSVIRIIIQFVKVWIIFVPVSILFPTTTSQKGSMQAGRFMEPGYAVLNLKE